MLLDVAIDTTHDPMTYRCLSCRQYFRTAPHRKIGLSGVCSDECFAKAVIGTKPTGPSRIPEGVRKAVQVRDGGRCRMCGTSENLHEHHIAYRSEGGTNDEHNLIVLCAEHHDLVHANKRRWQPVLFAYIQRLYGNGVRASLTSLDRQLNRASCAK